MFIVMTNGTNFFDGGFESISEARESLTRWLHYNPQVIGWGDVGDYCYIAWFKYSDDIQEFEIVSAE